MALGRRGFLFGVAAALLVGCQEKERDVLERDDVHVLDSAHKFRVKGWRLGQGRSIIEFFHNDEKIGYATLTGVDENGVAAKAELNFPGLELLLWQDSRPGGQVAVVTLWGNVDLGICAGQIFANGAGGITIIPAPKGSLAVGVADVGKVRLGYEDTPEDEVLKPGTKYRAIYGADGSIERFYTSSNRDGSGILLVVLKGESRFSFGKIPQPLMRAFYVGATPTPVALGR